MTRVETATRTHLSLTPLTVIVWIGFTSTSLSPDTKWSTTSARVTFREPCRTRIVVTMVTRSGVRTVPSPRIQSCDMSSPDPSKGLRSPRQVISSIPRLG